MSAAPYALKPTWRAVQEDAARTRRRICLLSLIASASTACMGETVNQDSAISVTPLTAVTVSGQRDTGLLSTSSVVATSSTTATKSNTPIDETPQSISVITREEMDQQNVHSVGDSLRYTPGVFADSRIGGVLDSVFLRGFGGFATEATSPQLLDGLPLPTGNSWAVATIDPNVLERVEVLRGPASVLYGQGTPGGTVNLTSKQPTDVPYHEISVEGGTRNHAQVSFDFSGHVTKDDTLSYRLNGTVSRSDQQIDYSKQKRIVLAPTVQWKPSSRTKVTAYAFYQNDPNNNYAGWVPASGSLWTNPAGKISTHFFSGDPDYDSYTRRQYMLGYTAEHQFNDRLTVRQKLRFTRIEADFKGLALNFTYPFADATGDLNRYASWSTEQVNDLVLDNQVETHFKTGPLAHTVLFGFSWDHKNSDAIDSAYGLASTINYLSPVYHQALTEPGVATNTQQGQTQIGAYVQDQIQLARLSVLLGLRRDWVNTDTVNRLTGAGTERSDAATTERVGATYRFDNGISPYASYATSFQPTSGTSYSGAAFRPTKGRQFELGVRYQPTNYDASLTLSAFDIHQKNVKTTDPENPLYYVQAAEVRSRGIEAEARASFGARLDAILAYTLLDTTLRSSTDGSLAGTLLPAVPRQIASLWLNYGLMPGAHVATGVRYIGRSAGDDSNTFSVPAVTLVDLAASVALQNWNPALKCWQLGIHVNNLFDRTYVASCFSEGGCFYGLRRSIIGNMRYQW